MRHDSAIDAVFNNLSDSEYFTIYNICERIYPNKFIFLEKPVVGDVRIYGTDREPLFVAIDVYAIIIEKKTDDSNVNKGLSKIINNYNIDDSDEFRELINGYSVISENRNKNKVTRKVNVLTKYGIYRMMADLRNYKIAKAFTRLIYIIRDELAE